MHSEVTTFDFDAADLFCEYAEYLSDVCNVDYLADSEEHSNTLCCPSSS